MKKSEKIEVRVSHEEKQRLSGIADARGLSVSELIRDAVAEDIGTVPHVPRWPGYAAIAAGALAVAALAVGLVRPGATDSLAATPAPEISLYSQTDAESHETALTGGTTQFTLLSEDGRRIRISATPGKSRNGTTRAVFEVCEVEGEACAARETFELTTAASRRHATRSFQFAGDRMLVRMESISPAPILSGEA